MHAVAILAALLVGPYPDERHIADGITLDLAFVGAVEEFARPPIPGPYVALFARLSADRYLDREAATDVAFETLAASRGDVRWLLAARRDPDPEIRVRLVAIGRRLYRCGDCGGRGDSRNWSNWACYSCRGRGHLFPFGPFD